MFLLKVLFGLRMCLANIPKPILTVLVLRKNEFFAKHDLKKQFMLVAYGLILIKKYILFIKKTERGKIYLALF
jgi:hypothetical protein